jgi:hypothetical protein
MFMVPVLMQNSEPFGNCCQDFRDSRIQAASFGS